MKKKKRVKIHNEQVKRKKVLAFLLQTDILQSGYRIEKATGIFWKDIPILMDRMEKLKQVKEVKTSAGNFYGVRVD